MLNVTLRLRMFCCSIFSPRKTNKELDIWRCPRIRYTRYRACSTWRLRSSGDSFVVGGGGHCQHQSPRSSTSPWPATRVCLLRYSTVQASLDLQHLRGPVPRYAPPFLPCWRPEIRGTVGWEYLEASALSPVHILIRTTSRSKTGVSPTSLLIYLMWPHV